MQHVLSVLLLDLFLYLQNKWLVLPTIGSVLVYYIITELDSIDRFQYQKDKPYLPAYFLL